MPLGMPSGNLVGIPFGMRGGFWHFGPPLEEIITEFTYFLLVVIISLYIYLKTKEIYELTKHKGIYHFRQIFLYFALAYVFRLLQIFMMFSRDLFSLAILPREFQPFNFFFVSYFSTLAILSVIVSTNIRNIKLKEKTLNIILHVFSFLASFFVAFFFSNFILLLLQTLTFLVALFLLFVNSIIKSKETSKFLSQNKITYVLLFVFWLASTFAFIRGLLPREIKIPLYIISVGVFFSIMFRVRKRLVHAEKKRSS